MSEDTRPKAFTMSIQGGMLEALGINMYTTLGKCLVEFVANAHDAESPMVDITIPTEQIANAREQVRREAKEKALAAGKSSGGQTKSHRGEVLLLALPEGITVTIRDEGHGMTPEQVQDVFLPVNRKRRLDHTGSETQIKTESGKRYAMGRKGLGKLAGFGAAERVRIETKRAGQTYATSFSMCYAELAKESHLDTANLPAEYIENLPTNTHYTLVELSGLKCDAVRNNVESIRTTIAEAFFGILPAEFDIRINGASAELPPVDYEYSYPPSPQADGFAAVSLQIDDMTEPLDYKYIVKFRKMGSHLPAAKRGARIYCNNRLAAGPTLLDLPTGMHNFHAQSYMECIVIADELDRFGVDIINTNRTSLRQDSELVEKFLLTLTETMRVAIREHAKFREGKASKEIEEDPTARVLAKLAQQLPKRTRGAVRKLLVSLAAQHGVDSEDFRTVAPLVLNAANAGEVLIRLSELGAHPDSIENVATQLRDLAEIERNDALKLYRARKNGIDALCKLEIEGENQWRQKGFENRLHDLFKREPWLIKAEFGRPLVSDQDMNKLATKIAHTLGVDSFSPILKGEQPDDRRPDLVFIMGDSSTPHNITIVELKSPSLPLEHKHLDQLQGYMHQVDTFMRREFPDRQHSVSGMLIGAMPDSKTSADGCLRLIYDISKRGSTEQWEVIGIRDLIERARRTHLAAIETIEQELEDEGDQGLIIESSSSRVATNVASLVSVKEVAVHQIEKTLK